MFYINRKKKIVCIGKKKDFLPLIDQDYSGYCFYYLSFSQFEEEPLSFRPDLLIFSMKDDLSFMPLPFSENSLYYSIPVLCFIHKGTPYINLIKKGAIDCLEKPVDPLYFEAKINSFFAFVSQFSQEYHNAFESFRTSGRFQPP